MGFGRKRTEAGGTTDRGPALASRGRRRSRGTAARLGVALPQGSRHRAPPTCGPPRGPGAEHPPPPPQGTGRRAPPPAALKPAVSQAVSHPLFAAPEPGSCAASVIPGSFLLLFCRLKSSAGWGGDSCSRPQERPARFS